MQTTSVPHPPPPFTGSVHVETLMPYNASVRKLVASFHRAQARPPLEGCSDSDRSTIEQVIEVVRGATPAGSETPVFTVTMYPERGEYRVVAYGPKGTFTARDFFRRITDINNAACNAGWKPVCVDRVRLHFPTFNGETGTKTPCGAYIDEELWRAAAGNHEDRHNPLMYGNMTWDQITREEGQALPALVIPVQQSSAWGVGPTGLAAGGGGGAGAGGGGGGGTNTTGGTPSDNPTFDQTYTIPSTDASLAEVRAKTPNDVDAVRSAIATAQGVIGRRLMWAVLPVHAGTEVIFKCVDNACYSRAMLDTIEGACAQGVKRVVNVSLSWPTALDGPLFTPLLKVFVGHAGHAGTESDLDLAGVDLVFTAEPASGNGGAGAADAAASNGDRYGRRGGRAYRDHGNTDRQSKYRRHVHHTHHVHHDNGGGAVTKADAAPAAGFEQEELYSDDDDDGGARGRSRSPVKSRREGSTVERRRSRSRDEAGK
jgi:hypothetical protein